MSSAVSRRSTLFLSLRFKLLTNFSSLCWRTLIHKMLVKNCCSKSSATERAALSCFPFGTKRRTNCVKNWTPNEVSGHESVHCQRDAQREVCDPSDEGDAPAPHDPRLGKSRIGPALSGGQLPHLHGYNSKCFTRTVAVEEIGHTNNG